MKIRRSLLIERNWNISDVSAFFTYRAELIRMFLKKIGSLGEHYMLLGYIFSKIRLCSPE
jgi:hypothetical protein